MSVTIESILIPEARAYGPVTIWSSTTEDGQECWTADTERVRLARDEDGNWAICGSSRVVFSVIGTRGELMGLLAEHVL